VGRHLASTSRTSGPWGGRNLGFIVASRASVVLRVGKACVCSTLMNEHARLRG
jgi:hypothetical protein